MMNRRRNPANPMPSVDESWWESVLAEEGLARRRVVPRPNGDFKGEVKGRDSIRSALDWARVKDLFLQDQIVSMHVTGCNRGGLLVEGEQLYGFVPFSHLVDINGEVEPMGRAKFMESYLGRTLRLKVIECVPEDGRIVFSERAAQAGAGKRAEMFRSLHPGEHVSGSVTNITDFGVFVDLGGVEGLIHISELSWGRVVHPGQILKLGQRVDVEVLDLAPERCRVALSLKRLMPNPWSDLETELTAGEAVPAVVTSVVSYGAFARLESGVEGLIHASEMPLAAGQGVREFLHEGQPVQVRVMHIDAAHQRMGLSMKLDL
jgi:small subunit ribosomal protein S1